MSTWNHSLRQLLLILGIVLLSGCASLRGPGAQGQKLDPWESWNRKVFNFNEALDTACSNP